MEGIYPISAILDGVGLNMTLMSYNGKLDFGLVADREMVPDIWPLIDYLGEELETLEKLAATEPSTSACSAATSWGRRPR